MQSLKEYIYRFHVSKVAYGELNKFLYIHERIKVSTFVRKGKNLNIMYKAYNLKKKKKKDLITP